MPGSWQPTCSPAVEKRISNLRSGTRSTVTAGDDRLKFSVRKDAESYSVVLGRLHTCSCKRAQPCLHVLAVLLDVFHLPATDPRVWQMGLREIEVEALTSQLNTFDSNQCVLCREAVTARSGCARCGLLFHWKCLELKSRTMGCQDRLCPACGAVADRTECHRGVMCTNCRRACSFEHYNCVLCPTVNLCATCFQRRNVHTTHPLIKVQQSSPSLATTASAEAQVEILNREIAPEDYDLLLSLDAPKEFNRMTAEQFSRLPKRLLFSPEEFNETCMICLSPFTRQATVVVLPCNHMFHVGCGRRWLLEHKSMCPIDQLPCVNTA